MDASGGAPEAAPTTQMSPLEKPLSQLTEEDIAQLTREDCRRFLKQKGMRRPSWNKSQAIQQVISLKALLDGRPDAADGIHRRKPHPPPPPQVSISFPREEAGGGETLAPAKNPLASPSPYRRRDTIPLAISSATADPPVAGKERPSQENLLRSSSRVTAEEAAAAAAGQMTIFYDGRVNVYDGVTFEKARTIMELAASPDVFDPSLDPAYPFRPLPARLSPAFIGPGPVLPAPPVPLFFQSSPAGKLREPLDEEWRAARGSEPEGPTSRKASLQRYLEKRKDRFKGKRILGGSSSASMEMTYISQKFRGQTSCEQSNRSNTCSPTQHKQPCTPTKCSSDEAQKETNHSAVDLNDDGGGKLA